MRPLRSCLLALGLLPCLPAQTLPADEAAALALLGQGRHAEAAGRLVALLRSQVAGGAPDDRGAALAEYAATMALWLASLAGETEPVMEALVAARAAAPASECPWLADRLGSLLLWEAYGRGDRERIAALDRQLGCADAFWLVGPFANERGSGFGRPLPPERELDMQAVYEGAERAVTWRRLPVRHIPAGRVDLESLLRPRDQVLCYAAQSLHAEEAGDVVLHLGTSGSYRVFLNGAEVGAREVRRVWRPDQDAVLLPLAEGHNLLLLKLCDQEGEFAFSARVTGPRGERLTDVRWSADAAALESAAATPSRAVPQGALHLGARTTYAAAAAEGDGIAALRLAWLLFLMQPDDETERRDHELARAAVEALPDLPEARYLLARTRERRTAHAAELEENLRRQDHLSILQRHPGHVESLLALARLDLETTGAWEPAERRVRGALAVNPDSAHARMLLADVLAAQGLRELARLELERAAGDLSAPGPPVARLALAAELAAQDLLEEATEVWNALVRQQPGVPHLVGAAEVHLRRGLRDRAVALLERAMALDPFAFQPRLLLAALHAEGDAESALGLLRELAALCPHEERTYLRMADIEGRLGRSDRQRELLRTALELKANLREERAYLEFLEAGEQPFFEDFRVDADALRDAAAPPDDAGAAGDPWFYLLRNRVVRAWRNGTTSEYFQIALQVLTEEGASRLSRFRVPHYRGEQAARVLLARVVKADGAEQRPRLRGSAVALPSLRPGDFVELQWRVDDLAPGFFGDYFGLQHDFASPDGAPVLRSLLAVVADPGREYRLQSKNGAPEPSEMQLADSARAFRYEVRDLPRATVELASPSAAERSPLVRVTTWRDWDGFASWWWNLIRKQLEVTPAMRAVVAELTGGLRDERDKIAAIYRFVTTDVRYEAWEFGVHGYKPYSTPAIFERRHGDCKDKALLLRAMLGEIGVEAWPALIRAESPRSEDDLTLPLVEHFNHCISWLPAEGERPAMFLDGTAVWHPMDTLPAMDQGAQVIVVVDGRAERMQVPWAAPEANLDAVRYDVELAGNGDAVVGMRRRLQGNPAVGVRLDLASEPGRRRQILEQRLTRRFGQVRLLDLSTSDLLDLDEPVELGARLHVTGFAARRGPDLLVKANLEPRDLQALAAAPERRTPLLLGVPGTERQEVRYSLPEGFLVHRLPEPVRIDVPFCAFAAEWCVEDGILVARRRLQWRAARIEPAQYRAFRELVNTVARADSEIAVLRLEGGGR